MTDAMDDLNRLIERVEAGTLDCDDEWDTLRDLFPMSVVEQEMGDFESDEVANLRGAYHGSLDAAKALHEALLPGWVMANMCQLLDVDQAGEYTGTASDWMVNLMAIEGQREVDSEIAETPARAWILAVLRAYRTAEGGGA